MTKYLTKTDLQNLTTILTSNQLQLRASEANELVALTRRVVMEHYELQQNEPTEAELALSGPESTSNTAQE